jgi:hypothetical protein
MQFPLESLLLHWLIPVRSAIRCSCVTTPPTGAFASLSFPSRSESLHSTHLTPPPPLLPLLRTPTAPPFPSFCP